MHLFVLGHCVLENSTNGIQSLRPLVVPLLRLGRYSLGPLGSLNNLDPYVSLSNYVLFMLHTHHQTGLNLLPCAQQELSNRVCPSRLAPTHISDILQPIFTFPTTSTFLNSQNTSSIPPIALSIEASYPIFC
jgi:hypothetical protein